MWELVSFERGEGLNFDQMKSYGGVVGAGGGGVGLNFGQLKSKGG